MLRLTDTFPWGFRPKVWNRAGCPGNPPKTVPRAAAVLNGHAAVLIHFRASRWTRKWMESVILFKSKPSNDNPAKQKWLLTIPESTCTSSEWLYDLIQHWYSHKYSSTAWQKTVCRTEGGFENSIDHWGDAQNIIFWRKKRFFAFFFWVDHQMIPFFISLSHHFFSNRGFSWSWFFWGWQFFNF